MKIYALVGESGTGKSHRAARIAREKNIEYMKLEPKSEA